MDSIIAPKEVTIDGCTYIAPNENFIGKLAFDLSQQIKDSGKVYDRLIYLPRGGLAFARQVLDCTGISKFSGTTIASYSGVGERGEARITKPMTDPVEGESVLVLDDIADSGTTLVKSKEYLLSLGARSVDIATIYTKRKSTLKPDYFAEQIPDNAWIVFPGERAEFIKDVTKKWYKTGVSYKEYQQRLSDIGLPSWYIDKYSTTP